MDHWEQIGNQCLKRALDLLQTKTTPTAATVEVVKGLVEIAVEIDMLNLQWAVQTRSGGAVWKGLPSERQEAGNSAARHAGLE